MPQRPKHGDVNGRLGQFWRSYRHFNRRVIFPTSGFQKDGRTVALFNVLHFGVQQLQRAIAVAEKRNIRRKEQRQALAVKD